MTPLTQPTKKSCGQTCVAMIAGVSLERAAIACDRPLRKGTNTKAIVRALNLLGVRCAQRMNRMPSRVRNEGAPPPQRAILRVNQPGRNWHWILLWDGVIYNPSLEEYASLGFEGETLTQYRLTLLRRTLEAATSYLEILP